MKIKPLISIILPIYNNSKHLRECLESLLIQTEKRIEIIAIDDFSNDNSFKILKSFKKSRVLNRAKRGSSAGQTSSLRIYKNVKKYGTAVTLNRALKKAKGQFVAFANPNYISHKKKIEKELKFLLLNPKIIAIGSQFSFFNSKGKKTGKSHFPLEHDLIYQSPLLGQSFDFESALINTHLLPKDFLRFHSTNFIYLEQFLKLKQYGEIANLKDVLLFKEKHKKESNITKKIENSLSFLRIWLKTVAIYDHKPTVRSFLLSFSYFLRLQP